MSMYAGSQELADIVGGFDPWAEELGDGEITVYGGALYDSSDSSVSGGESDLDDGLDGADFGEADFDGTDFGEVDGEFVGGAREGGPGSDSGSGSSSESDSDSYVDGADEYVGGGDAEYVDEVVAVEADVVETDAHRSDTAGGDDFDLGAAVYDSGDDFDLGAAVYDSAEDFDLGAAVYDSADDGIADDDFDDFDIAAAMYDSN